MNFYIGNSIDEINEQDVNVEFCDELIDFIYKMSGQVSFDMSKLYQIDPYDDVEVSKNDLFQIAEICKYILDTALLQNYEEPDEGRQMVQDLLEIIQKAMTSDLGLVSIGDCNISLDTSKTSMLQWHPPGGIRGISCSVIPKQKHIIGDVP